jgi:SNF2 family DNA or RNA helicase
MQKYAYKTNPYEHQRIALNQGALLKNYAYFMEMGTGKTKVAIDNASYLWQIKEITECVVIAPNSVYTNWVQEISTHCPLTTNVWCWKIDKDKKLVKFDKENKLSFILMNVEALSHKSGQKWLQKRINLNGKSMMMIIDESTTIKNPTALRTKAICKLGTAVKYRRILTGSPITKSPLDLYTQCAFLSKALLGFESFYTFRARYAVMHQIQMGSNQVLVPKYYTNLDELEGKLKGFSYRVKKDECLDLPPKVYQQRTVHLTLEQQEIYQRLKRKARAMIEDKTVSFNNKLTEILRLHQVCQGFLKTDEGTIHEFKNNPKLKELMAVLEESDGKVIIWANYVYNIKQIKSALEERYGKNSVVSIFGEVDVEGRKDAVNNFQLNDRCRFLVGNPATGGYGLTLTAARYVVYFSNSYNLEVRWQSEDRAHRIGQKDKVTYIDLMVPESLDVMIMSALDRKIKLSAQTLGEEAKRFLS